VATDIEQILALYDHDERETIESPGMRREVTPHVVRHVALGAGESCVIYSTLDEAVADAVIAEQVAYFKALGHIVEWKLYSHDRPADLAERLRARGFEPDEREALMILDLATLPVLPPEPADVEVRQVTDPDNLDDVVAVKNAVWQSDDDWIQRMIAEEMRLAPDNIRVYVAYADGIPASTAWIRFTPRSRFASLWGGSTLPAYRKRGLYTALLTKRLHDAQDRGVSYVTIDASPMSRPIVERYGFRLASDTTPYLLKQ